jgi:transposase InsO family protein
LPLHNLEVFVAHRNARLTVHGRRLIVHRVRELGMPVAHVAKAMGVSRQCAHRWIARFDDEGDTGLHDRSSRPHSMPTRTPADIEARTVAARTEHRRGQDWLGSELGVPARTVSRVLRRHDVPRLCTLDPLTGELIRSSKMTARRYERERPGELIHVDVKKIGRIPDGGGWRALGRGAVATTRDRKNGPGYDYVHSAVDDHSRLAYSEILNDERADTCAGFLERALDYFAATGIAQVERLITDNAWSYRNGAQLRELLNDRGIKHKFIKPHCPWQNGKVERYNRTLATEWAYRQVFTSNDERSAALPDFLDYYNHRRRHTALGGQPPISRLSPS